MALHVSTTTVVAVAASSAAERPAPGVTPRHAAHAAHQHRLHPDAHLFEQVKHGYVADSLQHAALQVVDRGDVNGTLHAAVTTEAACTPYLPAPPVQ